MLNRHLARRRQSGLSMVELLVGVTVGIFIVGGAISMFVVNLKTSRQMLVEARVNQDLRTAADIIARDLRRAGYWENAIAGTITDSLGSATTQNSYRGISANSSASTVEYLVARDTPNGRGDSLSDLNAPDPTDESFGFKLEENQLKMKIGTTWQSLTDPSLITINAFSISESVSTVDIKDSCVKTCTPPGCPEIKVRTYNIFLKGTAVSDTSVVRVLRERVRPRTEQIEGACPL